MSYDIPELYNRAASLMVKYPWGVYSSSDRTDAHFRSISVVDKIWELRWKAEAFANAVAYLRTANSLVKTGKFETEVQPRNLSQRELIVEILAACQQARDELDKQIKSAYASQEYFQKAIKDDSSLLVEGRYSDPPTPEQQQRAIAEMNKYYDGYRKDFSGLLADIESIVAYGSKIIEPKGEGFPP